MVLTHGPDFYEAYTVRGNDGCSTRNTNTVVARVSNSGGGFESVTLLWTLNGKQASTAMTSSDDYRYEAVLGPFPPGTVGPNERATGTTIDLEATAVATSGRKVTQTATVMLHGAAECGWAP